MCWWQRYVYFTAGPIALVAIVMNWRGAGPRLMSALSILIGLTFLVAASSSPPGTRCSSGTSHRDRPGCSAIGAGALPTDGIADGPAEQAAGDPLVQGSAVARAERAVGTVDGGAECGMVAGPRRAEPVCGEPAADPRGYANEPVQP